MNNNCTSSGEYLTDSAEPEYVNIRPLPGCSRLKLGLVKLLRLIGGSPGEFHLGGVITVASPVRIIPCVDQ